MLTRQQLLDLARQHSLDADAERIADLAQPAIHIQRQRVADESVIPVGASKLGGAPDVPAGFVWPHDGGKPLTFLAQFRLSQVAPFDLEKALPPVGMLSFFYDADGQPWGSHLGERDGWRVYFLPDETAPLARMAHPIAKGEFQGVKALAPCTVAFVPIITLFPPFEFTAQTPDTDERPDPHHRYWEMLEKVEQAQGLREQGRTPPHHRLLGRPDQIQGDVMMRCEVCSRVVPDDRAPAEEGPEVEARAQEWRLLFQVDTDDDDDQGLGIMWGDVGALYFCIRRQDLAARDFSRCWLALQCY